MLVSIGKYVERRGGMLCSRSDSSLFRPENVPAFLEAVKRREKVLSGFGHR